MIQVEKLREEFPILDQQVHQKPLIYMDNAATGQKPRPVLKALEDYYSHDNSNVHRGVHELSARATKSYEGVRKKVKAFINANSEKEVVFVKGTTEGLNLVAQSYGRVHLKPSDEILLTQLEHHSNIVPWQLVAKQTGAIIKAVDINEAGELDLDDFNKKLNSKTKVFAVSHVSNALGTINPISVLIKKAHEVGAIVVVDGAQAVPHLKVDVQALDCDFYAFSGHKMYGPTGIGVLYGKESLLEKMEPYQGGGDMIRSVTFEKTDYNELPFRFEAGTPNIAGAIGLGAAIDYIHSVGIDNIAQHEKELLTYATDALSKVEGLKIIGTAKEKASVISFVIDGIHPHDIGTIVDKNGVAIRTGHHCNQPLMERLKLPATARASFSVFNTKAEVDQLVKALEAAKEVFL